MKPNELKNLIDIYANECQKLTKVAFIRKLPNGKYRVLSEKGKNLGTYNSKEQAKKRLRQVEFFKHKKANIDLTEAEDFTLSSLMRQFNKSSKEDAYNFLKVYKNNFDSALEEGLENPERIALQNALVEFSKNNKVVINKDLVKTAILTELGTAEEVGKYLANIIRFTLTRISPKSRPKAIEKLKYKIYYLSESELANKKLPPASSMGQAITFVKHVLFNHDAKYIRSVINNIVRNL